LCGVLEAVVGATEARGYVSRLRKFSAPSFVALTATEGLPKPTVIFR